MTNPLSKELFIVLCCIVCGVVSGIWYDFFKALRKQGMNSKTAVMIQDGCFWIAETLIVFFMLFYANDAKLRWYEFFFVIFGFFSYRYLLSDMVVFVFQKLIILTVKAFSFLVKLFHFPVKKAVYIIKIHRKNKFARFLRRIFKRQQ